MSIDEAILQLVVLWEEKKNRGEVVDLELLCADRPELLSRLYQHVSALQSMEKRLATRADNAPQLLPNPNDSGTEPVPENLDLRTQLRIIKPHARGGLGQVFLAEDTQFKRSVAVKVIQANQSHDILRRRRFVQEAEVTSRLEHPGVVPVYGMGFDESGRPCYSMRFIEGNTLQQEIGEFHRDQIDPFANARAFRHLLSSFVTVCQTVAYAHSKGIIHRDIKPANIILGKFGETLLIDWGLAKHQALGPANSVSTETTCSTETDPAAFQDSGDRIEAAAPLTQQNAVLGTPGYLSPEQANSSDQANFSSDVWSLGATLFAILTGRPPIRSHDLGSILKDAKDGLIPIPQKLKPSVSRALEAICLRAMRPRPEERYESALGLAKEVEKWMAGEPVDAYPEPFLMRARRWTYRHRTLVTGLSVGSVVAIASLTILLVLTADANKKLREAVFQEAAERTRATENGELAEVQAELALRTLQTVVRDLQSQLKNVPAAQNTRRAMLEKALLGLDQVATNLDRQPNIDHNLLRANLELGDIFLDIGDDSGNARTPSAEARFLVALRIAEQLAKVPSDLEAKRQLAAIHRRLGIVSERRATMSAARESYQRALDLRQEIVKHPNSNDSDYRLIAIALDDLGDLDAESGKLDEAFSRRNQALEIRQELIDRHSEDPEVPRDMQVSYDKLGVLATRMSKSTEALGHFQKALDIARQRALNASDDAQVTRDLACALRQLGGACSNAGKHGEAEKLYSEALKLLEASWSSDPKNLAVERDLMSTNQRLGDHMLKVGRASKAGEHFQDMYQHCKNLVAADPQNQIALRDLALACGRQADYLEATGDTEAVIEFRNQELETSRRLAEMDPANPQSQGKLANALSKLAASLLANGHPDASQAPLQEAIGIYEEIWKKNSGDDLAWRNFLIIRLQLGVALKRTGHFDEARKLYGSALETALTIAQKDTANATIRLNLVTIYHSIGVLEFECAQFSKARKAFEEALKIVAQLEEKNQLAGDDLSWRATLMEALKRVTSEQDKPANSSQS